MRQSMSKLTSYLLLALSGGVSLHTASTDELWITTFLSGQVFKIDTVTGASTLIASGQGFAEDGVIDCKNILYFGGVFTGVKRIDTLTGTVLSPVGTNIVDPEGPSVLVGTGD